MPSKGLITINLKYVKKLIEKIKAKFSRKPLLVIPDVSVSVAGICRTCRFADREKDMCTAGSYWAEKGQNRVCYTGELWEATER